MFITKRKARKVFDETIERKKFMADYWWKVAEKSSKKKRTYERMAIENDYAAFILECVKGQIGL